MPCYHLSIKTVSRSAGRSAVAAAAYRGAVVLVDERTGIVHDYRRKGGVLHQEIVAPKGSPTWTADRYELWNRAERAELRKNSTVAREFEIALPAELSGEQRKALTMAFALELVERHGFVVDVAMHAPSSEGDDRNFHAHLLCTTRRIEEGKFSAKTRELDDQKSGEVDFWRERWAGLQNEYLQAAQKASRVDHRSHEARRLDREPTTHDGPRLTAIKRRTNRPTRAEQRRHDEWRRRQHERAAAGLEQLAALHQVRKIQRDLRAARTNVVPHIRPGERGEVQLDRRGPLSAMVAGPPRLDGRITYCWREWQPGMPQRPYWGRPALVDRGDRVSIVGRASQAKIDALVDLVRTKGWATAELFGSIEFQIQAAQALAAAGVPLTPGTEPEVQAAWERIAGQDPGRDRAPESGL